MAVPVKRLYHNYKTKRRGRKPIKSCDVNIIATALGVEVNELYRKEGEEVGKLEWLNEQEERCCTMLKENARRKNFFEDELSTIRELKELVQGNTVETDRPEA